jgi:hypothetical protein
MSLDATPVGEDARAAVHMPRFSAHYVAFAFIALALLAAATLMAHWSVDGAAPVAALTVISEVFDKGF